MSFSNRNYSRTQYHYLLQRDMYRRVQGFSQSPFTYTWRCRFRDAKNTVDMNANLLKVSRLFSINRRGRGWKEWREYRNRKLLGFEKFKRRCCKKKGSLSSRAFVEIASTKRGIANFELGVKIKKK